MFTTRLNGTVVSDGLKDHFLQFLANRRIKPHFHRVSERVEGDRTIYRNLLDWSEPVHFFHRKDAEDLAAELRSFAGEWSVVEVEKTTTEEPQVVAIEAPKKSLAKAVVPSLDRPRMAKK